MRAKEAVGGGLTVAQKLNGRGGRRARTPTRVFNLRFRTIYLLSLANKRGYITVGHIGATLAPKRRSQKTGKILERLLRQDLLRRAGRNHTYTLGDRGREYLELAGELLRRAEVDPNSADGERDQL
jgi:hypothetical protein